MTILWTLLPWPNSKRDSHRTWPASAIFSHWAPTMFGVNGLVSFTDHFTDHHRHRHCHRFCWCVRYVSTSEPSKLSQKSDTFVYLYYVLFFIFFCCTLAGPNCWWSSNPTPRQNWGVRTGLLSLWCLANWSAYSLWFLSPPWHVVRMSDHNVMPQHEIEVPLIESHNISYLIDDRWW